MAKKTNLFADKLVEKDMYFTRAQLNKTVDVMPPSVTRIISAAIKPRDRDFMKKQMRDKSSPMYKATTKGRNFHKALETGEVVDDFTERLVELFQKDILTDIDEVWAQEKSLVHKDHGFYGKFDGVGIYKGKLTLFDYKKTNKPKTTNSSMRNYLVQVCAYKKAHDEMYPDFKIEQVSLFNLHGKTTEELGSNVKTLSIAEVGAHTDLFYKHLMEYQAGLKTVYVRH